MTALPVAKTSPGPVCAADVPDQSCAGVSSPSFLLRFDRSEVVDFAIEITGVDVVVEFRIKVAGVALERHRASRAHRPECCLALSPVC
jgi:hypothetical protein